MASIKVMAETPELSFLPSTHPYFKAKNGLESINAGPEDSIPIIDFSLLTMGSPDQRSKVIDDLGKACEEWGFFLVINHGVPENLTQRVFDAADDFFNLKEEEKQEFNGKQILDPIICGTSFENANKLKTLFWRDYLTVISHPQFHFPNKPLGFSELALEYCMKTREVAMELLKGLMENLGIEEREMKEALNLDSGFQQFAVNKYPPCPNPQQTMGLPPHTDPGLLTLLIQNGVDGLQVEHNGKWVIVNETHNAFMVVVADQLEIFSNGKYKSTMHRALVNDKIRRLSIATPHGPSLDTIVGPYPNLLKRTTQQPAYTPMQYKEYMEQQMIQAMRGKTLLEQSRIGCE